MVAKQQMVFWNVLTGMLSVSHLLQLKHYIRFWTSLERKIQIHWRATELSNKNDKRFEKHSLLGKIERLSLFSLEKRSSKGNMMIVFKHVEAFIEEIVNNCSSHSPRTEQKVFGFIFSKGDLG